MAKYDAMDDAIFGVNLVKGVELVGEFVENKRAFWRFPLEFNANREEMNNFFLEINENHELVEAFSISSSSTFFRFGGMKVLKVLLYCDIIKVLELKNCDAGGKGGIISVLSDFIALTPTCSCVDLSGNNFRDHETKKLCNALENNNVVLEFIYKNNNVTNVLCRDFKTMLRSNAHIESLDLTNNPFTAEGETSFYEAMLTNDSLKLFEYKHIKNKRQEIIEKLRLNKLNWREKFIRDLQKEETGKWNRSKLMFIGQGRAGKTSTVHRLLSKGFDAAQDSTVGATVSQTQTSTTQEQVWKTIKEEDPEYLGAGMIGNQAGQLFAARQKVNKVDNEKKKFLAERKKKNINRGKKQRIIKAKELHAKGGVAIGLSEAAQKMVEEQQERDNRANQLFLEQEKLRQDLGHGMHSNTNEMSQVELDAEYARRLQEEEAFRIAKADREKEDDTAKHYADTVFAAAREKRDTITFSLWDYGGQAVFYALHHLFLTKYGVYVLCVDLTEILERPMVAKEYLSFWLNSVKLHAPTAPVLLVGTHLDSLKDKKLEALDEIHEYIKTHFSKKFRQLTSLHPKYNFYPVDNKNNKGVNELRFDVERISRKQEFVTADVSIKWMFCLDKIMVKRDTGGESPAWMKLSQVKHFAESVKVSSHEELERMLTMFHELGVLVRLTGTEELRNLITLDPQWLLDGLCKVIRDERLHGPSDAELDKVGLKSEMELLYKKGLATEDVMRYLWNEPKFKDHQNYLLDLMKFMVLISDWDFRDEKMFIIPSLLIPRPEDIDLFDSDSLKFIEDGKLEEEPAKANNAKSKRKVVVKNIFGFKKKDKKGKKKSEKGKKKVEVELVKEEKEKKEGVDEEEDKEIVERTEETEIDYVIWDFSKVFLPMGVFQRLVCMCVSYSTDLGKKKKKMKEPILYNQWAKIWMGNDTILYLEQKKDTIWLSVEDLETGPTCFKAVNAMLTKLNADLMGSGLEWDVTMQKVKRTINQKKGEKPTVTKVIDVDVTLVDARKKLLQPWFKKKEAAAVEEAKKEELLDLENFVDSF